MYSVSSYCKKARHIYTQFTYNQIHYSRRYSRSYSRINFGKLFNPIDYSISSNYLGFFPSILPLKLECMLITPNLTINMENWFELSGLVNMSAGCSLVRMCSGLTNSFCTFSRTRWQSISICLVHETRDLRLCVLLPYCHKTIYLVAHA